MDAGLDTAVGGSVLVVGIGGLGCPAALALALAGVSTIGLIDPDLVDVSNLQRQVLHFTPDLQRPKVESAGDKLSRLRPTSRLRTYPERLTLDNLSAVFQEYDFVIDATDGIATKFMINDAAVLLGKPFSYAGIVQFQGQTLTVLPRQTTCLRCLFPVPPSPDEMPICQEAGVLGSAAGTLGLLQAIEAVKYLSGSPGLLTDRLLTYDAQLARWREVRFKPNPRCPVCGPRPTITSLRSECYDEAGLCQLN